MSLGVAGVTGAELFIDLLAEDAIAIVGRDFPAKGSRQTAERVLKGRDSGPRLLFPKPQSTNSLSKRLQVNQNTNIFNRQRTIFETKDA